jgi:DnaJ-class molecular chaperone
MSTTIEFTYCKGQGIDPFQLLSDISKCQVCKGAAIVEIEAPFRTCVFCSGTGKNPLGARVPCIVCKGKGHNPITSEVVCEKCIGTGRAVDGLPCTSCNGIAYK